MEYLQELVPWTRRCCYAGNSEKSAGFSIYFRYFPQLQDLGAAVAINSLVSGLLGGEYLIIGKCVLPGALLSSIVVLALAGKKGNHS